MAKNSLKILDKIEFKKDQYFDLMFNRFKLKNIEKTKLLEILSENFNFSENIIQIPKHPLYYKLSKINCNKNNICKLKYNIKILPNSENKNKKSIESYNIDIFNKNSTLSLENVSTYDLEQIIRNNYKKIDKINIQESNIYNDKILKKEAEYLNSLIQIYKNIEEMGLKIYYPNIYNGIISVKLVDSDKKNT